MIGMGMRNRSRLLVLTLLACAFLIGGNLSAQANEKLKVGVLKFGTVNWLMDVIKHHELDRKNGFELELLPLASKNATSVALLSGEADSIVTDWLWALRERARGGDLQMFPYSAALGAVMVPSDSDIRTIADLKGKKIGVAGGPLDKSWLLLRARAEKLGAGDLARTATPVYGAPPLLNEQLIQGRVDAVLNFWHFAARLEGDGWRRLIGVDELMSELGISAPPPLIGFVFSKSQIKPDVIGGFAEATRAASRILQTSGEEWQRLRPLMKVESDAQFQALVKHYRAGMLTQWGDRERAAAADLFRLLADRGGEKLVGKNVKFEPGVFWSGLVF